MLKRDQLYVILMIIPMNLGAALVSGNYSLGHCEIAVSPTGHLYSKSLSQNVFITSGHMHLSLVVDTENDVLLQGPNLFGMNGHSKATLNVSRSGEITHYTMQGGGNTDSISGNAKLTFNRSSGEITGAQIKFSVAKFSSPSGLHSGPLKKTTADFACHTRLRNQ